MSKNTRSSVLMRKVQLPKWKSIMFHVFLVIIYLASLSYMYQKYRQIIKFQEECDLFSNDLDDEDDDDDDYDDY